MASITTLLAVLLGLGLAFAVKPGYKLIWPPTEGSKTETERRVLKMRFVRAVTGTALLVVLLHFGFGNIPKTTALEVFAGVEIIRFGKAVDTLLEKRISDWSKWFDIGRRSPMPKREAVAAFCFGLTALLELSGLVSLTIAYVPALFVVGYALIRRYATPRRV